MRTTAAALAAALLALASLLACAPDEPAVLPTPEQARALYAENVGVDGVDVSGNVVEFRIRQPPRQLQRGGSLWARVGPYIYVFSPSTRELFEAYPDVAAVRIVTIGPGGDEVARAMLRRDALSDIQWRRSLNLLGHALQEGTRRPTRLEDLIRWGERHTEHTYDEEYVE